MKYENLKSIILTILVLVSVLLTWNVWTYQPNYETIDNGNSYDISISDKKTVKDLIKPYKVFYHQKDATYGTMSEDEIDRLDKEIGSWSVYDLRNISDGLSWKEFKELVHGQDKVEIEFPDVVPFEVYKNLINFDDKNIPTSSFNRIVIDLKPTNKENSSIYFVSYDDRLVYESHVNSSVIAKFQNEFAKPAIKYDSYFPYEVSGKRILYMPKNPSKMVGYKYFYNEINPEKFENALFNDPSFVKKDELSDGEEYTDGSRLMNVDADKKMVTYVDPAEESESVRASSDLIKQSIDFVNAHGGWTDHYRYFNVTNVDQQISYRLFMQGIPVFSEDGTAEILQYWGREKIYQYIRPLIALDVPVPSETKEVQLSSGYSVIDYLTSNKNFKPDLLEDLVYGYKLSQDPDKAIIISLDPSWYYKYGGSWIQLNLIDGLGGKNRGLE
jgi:regulatory protein YycH of two-component signal transduction system YycFG